MATTQDTFAMEKTEGDLKNDSLKDVESASGTAAEPRTAVVVDEDAERSYGRVLRL